MLSSHQRVLAACQFRRPDRIPHVESFWEYPESWRRHLGDPEDLTDVTIWYPEEAPFPSRAGRLKEEAGYVYEVDAWGRTVRRRHGAFFVETLTVSLPDGVDPQELAFESPGLDSRYLTGKAEPSVTFSNAAEAASALEKDKRRHCVFGKTGGPYLR